MNALAAVYDPDIFEGLDINQGSTWLDTDGVTHRILDMLVTERLAAAASLETMAARLPGGAEMVHSCTLYRGLIAVDTGD